MSDLLPCPFCGHTGLSFEDGSTHRWGIASCDGCGAATGEVRRNYPDDGKWHAEAIKEWNRRAQPAQAVPLLSDEEVDSVWDAIPQTQFWWRRYARAVEAAVRAKQATPLPAEQIQKLRHLIDWTDAESYLTFARAVEAAHGVGKEGSNVLE